MITMNHTRTSGPRTWTLPAKGSMWRHVSDATATEYRLSWAAPAGWNRGWYLSTGNRYDHVFMAPELSDAMTAAGRRIGRDEARALVS